MAAQNIHLYLKNLEQLNLWNCELEGQITDGAWENSRNVRKWDNVTAFVKTSIEEPFCLSPYRTKISVPRVGDPSLYEIEMIGNRCRAYVTAGKLGISVKQYSPLETALDYMGQHIAVGIPAAKSFEQYSHISWIKDADKMDESEYTALYEKIKQNFVSVEDVVYEAEEIYYGMKRQKQV